MLDGYIPLLVTLVLVILAMYALFSAIPSIGEGRYKKNRRPSLKSRDIIENLQRESNPPVRDTRYLEPYESGEVARGDIGKNVTIQYIPVILLFILFDVDMVLLFPWAYRFKSLGIVPFVETIIFLVMPLFVVYYAFKEGYMRWER
ncbi:hypothetical protein GCM10007108_00350 [Thermogymnomonas acidicola]|uniref:NADH-quinone oxidoreductase subunit A n=1 Tax=Thermogymnomonas acidicola TaxID=399579 RepID=A0AA37BPI5_9ARCH|nr:NADH-quinone oxidoreductase subunit A [Thermogymnomonas acidicola]GGM65985.1 hypothetical protein GCM10007108_00350 [Thermogymnomonas acidicola]